jgi:hypothetical protein
MEDSRPTARPGDAATMVSMTDPDPRAAFAAMTAALITDFRANGGRVTNGPFAGRPVLLLTTTGAKSGQPRLAPVVYSRDGDAYASWLRRAVRRPIRRGTTTFSRTPP